MSAKKLDRVYCDNLKDYQDLKKTPLFKKTNNAMMFMMTMALGFKRKSRVPLKKGKDGLSRLVDFKDYNITLIKSLALKETKDVNVLLNDEEIYKIAEEYANGGIKIIKNFVIGEDPGSYIKKLCTELLEISKKIE